MSHKEKIVEVLLSMTMPKVDGVSAAEIADAILAKLCEGVEPVGEAGNMPGTEGFTMACFKATDVPPNTKLYAGFPPDAQREINRLIHAVAEHVTVRSEQYGRIVELEKQLTEATLQAMANLGQAQTALEERDAAREVAARAEREIEELNDLVEDLRNSLEASRKLSKSYLDSAARAGAREQSLRNLAASIYTGNLNWSSLRQVVCKMLDMPSDNSALNAAIAEAVEPWKKNAERYRHWKGKDFCVPENITAANSDELTDAAIASEKGGE